jgi:hypothetical protein
MPKGLLFWILMILWFFFGLWWNYEQPGFKGWLGSSLLLFVLLFILGWAVFGFVVQ